jgi:hypothetical protein
MDADNGGVDHLNSGIMGSGKCVYDAAPDTSPPPADEPVVASGVWAKRHRQITPRCSRSQDPEDTIEDTSVVHPRNATWLVRQHRPYGSPFIVLVAHDSSPQSGSLNHRGLTHRKELLARPWFGVFGAGADINLPTILNETVENDVVDDARSRHRTCQRVIVEQRITGGVIHMEVSTIGVDLAKNVFQVHGVDSLGKVVITRQLRRKQVIDFFSKIPACLVGMEACGTAHHWAREISKLGHTVRLMPPSYVKGYVKRSKNDAADAAARS